MGSPENVLDFLWQFTILAQAGKQAAPAGQPDDPYWPIRMAATALFAMGLFYFMFIRPQKRKEQDLRDSVNRLKENDRVVTIGGIHGVVTNVQRDLERVTIRVDETNGTKLRMNISAIARVVTGDDVESGGASEKKS